MLPATRSAGRTLIRSAAIIAIAAAAIPTPAASQIGTPDRAKKAVLMAQSMSTAP
jgi:hypothetical protein